MKPAFVLAFTVIFIAHSLSFSQEKQVLSHPHGYEILLKSRHFTPAAELDTYEKEVQEMRVAKSSREKTFFEDRVHIILQLRATPSTTERKKLENDRIHLLQYIPNNAWFASVPNNTQKAVLSNLNVRWAGKVRPEDKISNNLREGKIGEWARKENDTIIITMRYFEDIEHDRVLERLQTLGVEVVFEDAYFRRLNLVLKQSLLTKLANEDFVQWMEEVPPPPKELNDNARANARVDEVHAAPYNLDGKGVKIGIWDSGKVDNHIDFSGRLKIKEHFTGVSDHATHVAGTLAGDGSNSENQGGKAFQWRGVAYAAEIFSYRYNNPTDLHGSEPKEVREAIESEKIVLSQNSWGAIPSLADGNCYFYGKYSSREADYDKLVRERQCVIVFACGNERNDGDCPGLDNNPPYVNYSNITPPATAKNVISVGAIDALFEDLLSGSSWGPVADGRIKPEVVAVGASTVFEGTTSTLPNDIYENEVERENNQGQKVLLPAAGTSMAAPVVSGIAALIIQQYRTIHGTDPLASTVKALLINTATDMGNKGPDFSYGFGKVDAKAAINSVIEKHDLFGVIGENSIHRYPAEVSSSAESLKVTLVWDDIPAPDNAQKTLINDLKLEVISPTGKKYDPYILDPSVGNESKVATRGVDHINPVEQVVIHNNEMEAGTWSVNVEGDKVPQGPQVYSLVISPFEPEPGKVVISDGIFEDPSTIFAGDEFEITFALKETEGRPVLLQEVGVDIFDANNTLVRQLTRYNNVTVAANGAWDYRSTIVSLDIPGTYRAVAKAVIDEAFVLEAEDSARNPKAFSVNDKFTQNVDIALVIDRSGSMNDENKISDAKKAANFFVGFMQNGDNLAVVSFFVSAAIDFPLTTISGHSTIQNAQNAINRIFADGGTSIAAGILAAQEELNKGNASNPHAIVLLSDGISSAEDVENALSTLPEKTIIHTIALGSDADHDLLNRIASKTGGTFNPSSAANVLQLIYENIQGQITGMATAANNLGAISQGATTSHTVTLDALTSLAFFRMGFEGSDVDMELISPTGKEVTPSSAASDPAIDYTEGSTYDFYTVLSPKPGNWTQKIIGVNVPTPETYVASVQVVSQLNLGLTLDRDEYQINEPILISAVLTENGSPLTGASVIADVTSPSASLSAFREASPLVHHSSESAAGNAHPPTTSNLSVKTFEYNSTLMTLYDDGVHGDGVANDGIYANSLTQTQHDGSYSFTVRASGFSSQGGNFERESAISTFVDVPDDQITLLGLSGIEVFVIKQSPSDQSVLYAGTNGNGLYKGSVSSHSWSPVSGGLNDNFIYNLQIDPNNSSTIFAGTGGSSGSNSEGVYKSFDGGDSWVVKNDGLPQKQVFSLALDRNNPNIVYAGTNRFGVYKSLNAGDNWSSANNGIPSGREIHVMAIHPTNPKIVLAGTKSGVIYKSFDNGSSWSSRNFPNHSSYIFDFLFDDKNPDVVYASTWGSGVYKSTNGGETWFRKDNGLSDTRIASLAMSAGKLYAGTNSGGIFTSEDNAENWNHFSDQGTFQKVHDIVFKTNDPSTFYAGTNSGVYRVKDPSLAGVVATPILNPPTGTYSKGITVYMYISTNDATIYYTTDGSFPSESSQQYTSPFTVSSSQTITARAFRSGFIPSSNASSVYIITGTTASPQFEPQPGTYTSPVQVSISTTTPGAAIHFTGDSSEPTQSSEIYASSIPVSSTTTVRARAYKSGWAPSHEVSGTYEIRGVLTAPRLDPAPGNYATSLDVSISTTVDDATVRYTVNGSTPTTSSPVYNSPIPVTQTTTIKAASFKTGWPAGNMTTGAYVITGKLDPLQFDPPPGTFDSSVNVTLSSTVEDAIIYFTLDNSEPTESAFPYSDQIMIDSTATLKARAYKSGWAPGDVMSGKYVIDKPTSVQDAPIPEKFVLYQNYPNPFNPETRISFDLPETQHVEITIFNATGQRIKTIANRRHEAGTYSIVWNARDNLGNPVGSGIYFYRIKTVKFIQTKKMALLR